jgi:hypothetical protein
MSEMRHTQDLSEIQKAKLVVLQNAFGICSLPEPELYQALEKIYWLGFKAGNEFNAAIAGARG